MGKGGGMQSSECGSSASDVSLVWSPAGHRLIWDAHPFVSDSPFAVSTLIPWVRAV